MHILKFLQYIPANVEEQLTKRLSFPDGLTNTLESYVNSQEIRKGIVFTECKLNKKLGGIYNDKKENFIKRI